MLKCLKALLTQMIACLFECGLCSLSHKLVHVYSLATLDVWLQFFKEWMILAKVSFEVANTASHWKSVTLIVVMRLRCMSALMFLSLTVLRDPLQVTVVSPKSISIAHQSVASWCPDWMCIVMCCFFLHTVSRRSSSLT